MAEQTVKLANGERLVKRYDCFNSTASFGSKTKNGSIILTTERLIYSEKGNSGTGNTTYTNQEVRAKDIKTVYTSYEKDIPLLSIVIIGLIGIILFLFGVTSTEAIGAVGTIICVLVGLGLIGLAIYRVIKAPVVGSVLIYLEGSSEAGILIRRPVLRETKMQFFLQATEQFVALQKELGALIIEVQNGKQTIDEIAPSAPITVTTVTEDDDEIPLL